jgi:cation:H+ antiporter
VTWLLFLGTVAVILVAGVRLARYGDVLAEKSGLGRTWIGLVVVAATTSLPELVTGFSSTVLFALPDIAVGDVLGSCMFNLLILSLMDAVAGGEALTARAHQGHSLSIGFGLLLMGIAGIGLFFGERLPAAGWVGLYTPALVVTYLVAIRLAFTYERRRVARDAALAELSLLYEGITLRTAAWRYAAAAAVVVTAATFLPPLGERIAEETGLAQAVVGSLFIALTTSLPEVVVSLAAVRMGALDLGVGNVLGSNLFNMLVLAFDDAFFTEGPILSAADAEHGLAILAVVMMYAVLLVGLTYQLLKKRFVIAWDTAAIAAIYAVTIAMMLS